MGGNRRTRRVIALALFLLAWPVGLFYMIGPFGEPTPTTSAPPLLAPLKAAGVAVPLCCLLAILAPFDRFAVFLHRASLSAASALLLAAWFTQPATESAADATGRTLFSLALLCMALVEALPSRQVRNVTKALR